MTSHVERQPWRAMANMVFTVQLFYMLMDLAVNKGVDGSWHNAVVTIEFVSAVFLAAYQLARIVAFLRSPEWADRATLRAASAAPTDDPPSPEEQEHLVRQEDDNLRRYLWLLSTSLLLQVIIAIFAACSYRFDSPPVEWAMYAVAVAWSIVNAWSLAAVADASKDAPALDPHEQGDDEGSDSHMGTSVVNAFRSTFSLHIWPRERCHPWIYGSALLAMSHAAMVGLQGIMIDWLMELSFGMSGALSAAADLYATTNSTVYVGCITTSTTQQEAGVADDAASCESRLSLYAYGMVAVWFGATACRVMYNVVNSSIRLTTELWLRDCAFAVRQHRVACSDNGEAGHEPDLASLLAVYDVDIEQVLEMHKNLQEIFVDGLLVVSTYAALLFLNTKVGILSLSVGSLLAILSGPTPPSSPKSHSASDEEDSTPVLIKGSTLLNESPSTANDGNLRQRHRKQVLIPLEARWLQRTVYSDAATDVYVVLFGTFLTVTVIVCIAWEVVEGLMSPSRVLPVFFAFIQLLRAATKLPALHRDVVARSSSLMNVNRVLGLQEARKFRVIKEQETNSESAEGDADKPSRAIPVRESIAAVPNTTK